MRLRLILLGGGNALGKALMHLGAEDDIAFVAPIAPEGDWCAQSLQALFAEVQPDLVLNLAYYYDWFQAGAVNPATFPPQEQVLRLLAERCAKDQVTLIQPSSYRVFDGARATAYSEKEECQPLSPRGQALMRMEQVVRKTCEQHIILRLGWVLDDNPQGLLGRVLQRAQDHQLIEMADDRRGNPTPIADVARVLMAILKQLDCGAALWGTYHYGGQEAATSLAVGKAILAEAKQWRPQLSEEVIAQPHAYFSDATIEPQHGVLDNRKITYTFGIKPRAWRAGLAELLDSYYRNV